MNDDTAFVVESVLNCKFCPLRRRFVFVVKWKDYVETTEEPLENFLASPLLILDLEKKQYRELCDETKRSNNEELRQKGRRKLRLESNIGRRSKSEFIPDGTEVVGKIYGSSYAGTAQFYEVKFYGIPENKKVRLQYMEYYFPSELLSFWDKNVTCIPENKKM